MATTEAQRRARNKWNKENTNKLYDRVSLLLQKGQKEALQSHAATQGESLNAFVNRAIAEAVERDNARRQQ